MTATAIGLELGTRWFHVVGKDAAGHVLLRQTFKRCSSFK